MKSSVKFVLIAGTLAVAAALTGCDDCGCYYHPWHHSPARDVEINNYGGVVCVETENCDATASSDQSQPVQVSVTPATAPPRHGNYEFYSGWRRVP